MALTETVPLIAVSQRSAVTRALDKYFYCFMSLLIAAVVFYGFSLTVNKNLIHPPIARPWILWLHGIVFSGWLLFFILQSALVRARSVRWHRNMGWFGAALGAGIFLLGVTTTITMAQYDVHQLHRDVVNLLAIPFGTSVASRWRLHGGRSLSIIGA